MSDNTTTAATDRTGVPADASNKRRRRLVALGLLAILGAVVYGSYRFLVGWCPTEKTDPVILIPPSPVTLYRRLSGPSTSGVEGYAPSVQSNECSVSSFTFADWAEAGVARGKVMAAANKYAT